MDTTFVSGTTIQSDWLNDVNAVTYHNVANQYLLEIGGVPYFATTGSAIGIGTSAGGIVINGGGWHPAIDGAFSLGLATHRFSQVHFGAVGGQLVDITGTPTLYTSSASVGLRNATGEVVLDNLAVRPAIDNKFSLGTASYRFSSVHFGTQGGRLIDVAPGTPMLYSPTASVGLGNATGGIVLDNTAWRPSISGTFALGSTSYPFSGVYFGAINAGRLIEVSSVPYLYSAGYAVGLGNGSSAYGVVYASTSLRPTVTNVLDLGSSTVGWKDAYIVGKTYFGQPGVVDNYITNTGANLDFCGTVGVVPSLGFSPKANNAQYLGGSALRWTNVYSVLGNFSSDLSVGGNVGFNGATPLVDASRHTGVDATDLASALTLVNQLKAILINSGIALA